MAGTLRMGIWITVRVSPRAFQGLAERDRAVMRSRDIKRDCFMWLPFFFKTEGQRDRDLRETEDFL